MGLNLVSLVGSVENLLLKNNTTTATNDISNSLTTRVQKTYKGVRGMHTSLPVMNISYPVVFVELGSTSGEFAQLGRSANRNIEIDIDIVCVTNYGLGSADEGEGRENADLECIRLSQNTEALIRSKISLSSTVDWCNISNVDYSADVRESTYNSISKITIQARKLST